MQTYTMKCLRCGALWSSAPTTPERLVRGLSAATYCPRGRHPYYPNALTGVAVLGIEGLGALPPGGTHEIT